MVHDPHIGKQWAGIEKLPGTYPFTLDRSVKAFRLNNFLHELIKPDTRTYLRDCLDHRGALTHRYAIAALHRAHATLPPDVNRYTDCARGIASQIHTLA